MNYLICRISAPCFGLRGEEIFVVNRKRKPIVGELVLADVAGEMMLARLGEGYLVLFNNQKEHIYEIIGSVEIAASVLALCS